MNTDTSDEMTVSSAKKFSSTTSVKVAVLEGLLKRVEIVGQEAFFECMLCERSMTGVTPAQAHLEGVPHMKVLKKYNQANEVKEAMRMMDGPHDISRNLYPDAPSIVSTGFRNKALDSTADSVTSAMNHGLVTSKTIGPVTELICSVCNVSCNSDKTMEQHLQGGIHLKNIREYRVGGIQNATASRMESQNMAPHETPYIPVSKDALEVARNVGIVQQARVEDPNHLRCVVCNVFCTGDEPMLEHLKGKSHLKKQKWIQPRDKFQISISTQATSGLQPEIVENSTVTQVEVKKEKYSPPPSRRSMSGSPPPSRRSLSGSPPPSRRSLSGSSPPSRRSTTDSPPLSGRSSPGSPPSSPRRPTSELLPSLKRPISDSPLKCAMDHGILLENEFGYECLICSAFFNDEVAITSHLQDEAHKRHFQEHVAAESSFIGTTGNDEQSISSSVSVSSEYIPPVSLGTSRPDILGFLPTPQQLSPPRKNCSVTSGRQSSDIRVYSPSESLDDLFD